MTPKQAAQQNLELIREIRTYEQYKKSLSTEAETNNYDEHIKQLSDQIKNNANTINDFFIKNEIPQLKQVVPITSSSIPLPSKKETPKPKETKFKIKEQKTIKIPSKTKDSILKELSIDEEALKKFLLDIKKIKVTEEAPYILYKTTNYGKISNKFFENLSFRLTKKYPKFFQNLYTSLISSNIKVLSKTYVSMILFSSSIAFILSLLIPFSLLIKTSITQAIIKSILIAILASIITFALTYLYPSFTVNSRRREIKNDLPFAIIHMSAVASSGAKPVSIFNLILKSEEYKGLNPEIRKIVNYINLFGYDLSTSLRLVASTTPSSEFKELLTGMVSTIESGGSLKDYLKGKSEDTLSTYKLERKKYTDILATYSDIYTAILIAAPLLFITTLAIINVLGGEIGGLTVSTISTIGTYFVIPFLNIAFIFFLNIIQPE